MIKQRSNAPPPTRNPRVISAADKLSNALGSKVIQELNQIGGQKRDRDLDSTQDRNLDLPMSKRPTRSQDVEDGELQDIEDGELE